MPKQKWLKLLRAGGAAECAISAGEVPDSLSREMAGCEFLDERIGRRFQKLVRQLSRKIGQTIPLACQDWSNTKAAYRFLSNERVSEAAILAGHFQATRDRLASVSGPVLMLHDTTEFICKRPAKLSITHKFAGREN